MPFVSKDHRQNPDPQNCGDRCFMWYRWMIKQWNKEPRWKTADEIYAQVMRKDESLAEQRAKELAWQVFFIFKILPYEELKAELNGEINE